MSEHKESVSQFFCLHFHSLIHSLIARHFIACLHSLNLNFTQHFANSCHSLHICYPVIQHTSVECRHLHCHLKLCSCRVIPFTWLVPFCQLVLSAFLIVTTSFVMLSQHIPHFLNVWSSPAPASCSDTTGISFGFFFVSQQSNLFFVTSAVFIPHRAHSSDFSSF